ncbi:MAG: fibronectin type III domain-containing protein, partial [Ruminococcus sp.]|nr:fibronectin type III domain-containing protein [Ruminococcus sp.]
MKNTFKRILSVVLCFILAFSTAAFAFAAEAENAITYGAKYFQKTSTDANNAGIVLDKIDEVLKDADIKEVIDLKVAKITVDVTSISALCNTVDEISDWKLALNLLGDLGKFNFKNWNKGMKRGSTSDVTILSEIIELLSDNSSVIAKLIEGEFSCGTIADSVLKNKGIDLKNINIYAMVKDMLIGLVYKDENSAEFKAAQGKKLDNFIYEDVLGLINKDDGALPGFTMNTDSTVDNLLLNVFSSCYNKYIVPAIRGIKPESLEDNGNSALIQVKKVINLDGSKFDENTVKIETTKTFSSQINGIVGDVLEFFVPGFSGWEDGDTNKIGANLTALYRYLAGAFNISTEGTDADIAVRVVNYILNAIKEAGVLPELNDYVAGVGGNMTIETLITMVLSNTAKAQNIPVKANGNYKQLLGDMLGYAVQDYIDIGYKAASGREIWDVLNDILNVFLIDKGFANALNIRHKDNNALITKDDSLFDKIDVVLDMTGTKLANYDSKEFIEGLFDALFKFDIETAVNKTVVTFLNDYANEKAIKVIYDALYNILKNCMGKEIIVGYTANNPLDNMIQNSSLKKTVENLLTQLNANKAKILPPVLYVAAMVVYGTAPSSEFEIAKIADQVCTGKALTPAVTVKVNGKTLKSGTDYVAEYANNTEIGTAQVTINGIGQYKGSASATFNIVLGKVANLKPTPSTTSASLTWTAVAGATSYQVTCNGKTTTVKTNKATVSGLTADKKYTATVKAIRGNASTSASTSFVTKLAKPAKVTGLKASSITATGMKLTWTAVKGAASYQVSYSTDGKKWTNTTVTKNTATLSKLTANKTYQIKVRAYAKATASTQTAYGDYSSVLKAATLLVMPTVKASASNSAAIKVTWGKVAGATGYTVEYSADGKKWTAKNVTATNYTVSKLKANTTYQFRVRAYSKKVKSAYSSVLKVSTAPAKVAGLKVSATTSKTIKLTWTAVKGASGYVVQYSTDGKTWKSVNASKNSATLSKLAANKAYQIKVYAIKKTAGITAKGTVSAVVKTTTKVAAPTGLKASKTDKSSVTLTWKKVSGATGYIVYRNGKKVATITKGSTVTFKDTGLKK